jgi:ribonuclease G
VQASILFAEEIENNLNYLIKERKLSDISLLVHPYLEAYFKRGLFSKQMRWFMKYGKWIPVQGVTANHLLEYTFVNKDQEEIAL